MPIRLLLVNVVISKVITQNDVPAVLLAYDIKFFADFLCLSQWTLKITINDSLFGAHWSIGTTYYVTSHRISKFDAEKGKNRFAEKNASGKLVLSLIFKREMGGKNTLYNRLAHNCNSSSTKQTTIIPIAILL